MNKQRRTNRKETNLQIHQATNNAIKCSSGDAESLSHKITKFWLAAYCWENGLHFATEVVFKDNQRADFVVKDWKIAIEILGTESVGKFAKKTYPIFTIPISCMMSVYGIYTMMEDLATTEGKEWEFYKNLHVQEMKKRRKIGIKTMKDAVQ